MAIFLSLASTVVGHTDMGMDTHTHSLHTAQVCAVPGPFPLIFYAQEMCYSQSVCEGSISFAIDPCMESNMSGFAGACVYL